MTARDELVSFAEHTAHDLKNTLAALTMSVELAIDVLPDDMEALESMLERVERCAAKLASTVEAMPGSAEVWPMSEPLDD